MNTTITPAAAIARLRRRLRAEGDGTHLRVYRHGSKMQREYGRYCIIDGRNVLQAWSDDEFDIASRWGVV